MPLKPPALRARTGQRPSQTRSAGSLTTCRQRFAPRCGPSRLSVRIRQALLGPGSLLRAYSAASCVTCKPVSPGPTPTSSEPRTRPRAGPDGSAPNEDPCVPPPAQKVSATVNCPLGHARPDSAIRAPALTQPTGGRPAGFSLTGPRQRASLADMRGRSRVTLHCRSPAAGGRQGPLVDA
jgi:hypothetical protein